MIELKTLKDINVTSIAVPINNKTQTAIIAGTESALKYSLKAEAIKWVNYRKNKLYGFPIIKGSFNSEQVGEAIRSWIKHFFNLTEEDLK